ncbi:hypothetical protein [Bacillus subtilis]
MNRTGSLKVEKEYAALVEMIACARYLAAFSENQKVFEMAENVKKLGDEIAIEFSRGTGDLGKDSVERYDIVRNHFDSN